jgi:cephalosporin hydroxylase
MCHAINDKGLVLGIDLQDVGFAALFRWERFAHVKDSSIDRPTYVYVRDWAEWYGGIDVVFQDSSHDYDESCKEWDLYSPLMTEGGVWVCDDIVPGFEGMERYFAERPGVHFEFPELHPEDNVGVILL